MTPTRSRHSPTLTLTVMMVISMILCTGCDVADVLGAIAGALSSATGSTANANTPLAPGGSNANVPFDPGLGAGNSNGSTLGSGGVPFGGFNGGGQPFAPPIITGRQAAPQQPGVTLVPRVSQIIPQGPQVPPRTGVEPRTVEPPAPDPGNSCDQRVNGAEPPPPADPGNSCDNRFDGGEPPPPADQPNSCQRADKVIMKDGGSSSSSKSKSNSNGNN